MHLYVCWRMKQRTRRWRCRAKGCTGTVFELNEIRLRDLPGARCDGEQIIGEWKVICDAAASAGYMPKGMQNYSCTTCGDFDLCLSCFSEVVKEEDSENDSDISTDLELTRKTWDSNSVDGCGSELLSSCKRKRTAKKTKVREDTPVPKKPKRLTSLTELARLAAVQEENDKFVLKVQRKSPGYRRKSVGENVI